MKDPVSAPVETPWGPPGLPDLLDRLRTKGFAISPAEAQDAARLLLALASRLTDAPDASTLRAHLQPLLCKQSGQRPVFQEVFDTWWQAHSAWQPPSSPTPTAESASVASSGEGGPKKPVLSVRQGLVVAAGLLAAVLIFWKFDVKPESPQIQPSPPAAVDQVKPAPPSPVAPSAPGASASEPAAGSATRRPDAPAPRSTYSPAFAYGNQIQMWVAWLLMSLSLPALLGLGLFVMPRLALSRLRGRLSGEVRLDRWETGAAARKLVPPLDDHTRARLERHMRAMTSDVGLQARRPRVDLRRTVHATIRRLGVPHLRYRHARIRPSYLVLVEASSDDALPVLWAERLRHDGVDVDLRRVASARPGEPPLCVPVRGRQAQACRFDHLPPPSPGQRLVLVSDGGFLLDEKGDWQAWALAARLDRWPIRVAFSPLEVRDMLAGRLGRLDQGLRPGDMGLLVLPQEESALDAWSTWLATGNLPPIVQAEREAFPRLLAEKGDAWAQTREAPPQAEAERLVSELRLYLGENGFHWLCCCAVPPVMDGELTLLLGEAYFLSARVEADGLPYFLTRNYRLLARLPWVRSNHLPDWLRLALLRRLPAPLQHQIRRVVERLLAPVHPHARGDLRLTFASPKPFGQASSGDMGELPRPETDSLYLGFMDGNDAQTLSLRIPGPWNSWVRRLPLRRSAWQGWRERLARVRTRLQWETTGSTRPRKLFLAGTALVPLLASLSFLAALDQFPSRQWPLPWRGWLFEPTAWQVSMQDEAGLRPLRFSPDSRWLLAATPNGRMRLWDALNGEAMGPAMQAAGEVAEVVFSPDGKRLASVTQAGVIETWDTRTRQALTLARHLPEKPILTAFSEDGRFLLTAAGEQIVRWDVDTGLVTASHVLPETQSHVAVAGLRPDGALLVVSADDDLLAFDSSTLKALSTTARIADPGPVPDVQAVRFSKDRMLWFAASAGDARLWDLLTSGKSGRFTDPVFNEPLASARLNADGSRLLTIGKDQVARLWNTLDFSMVGQGHVLGAAGDAQFHPDGEHLLIRRDERVQIWNAQTGKAEAPAVALPEETQGEALFSPDGQQLVMATTAGQAVLVLSPNMGRAVGALMPPALTTPAPQLSPDGDRMLLSTDGRTLRTWDAVTGAPVSPAMPHAQPLSNAIFSPDGRQVLSASNDGKLSLWDAATGKRIGGDLDFGGAVTTLAFSLDGRKILATGATRPPAVWSLAPDGRPSRDALVLSTPGAAGWHAAYLSPDGRFAMALGEQSQLELWDLASPHPGSAFAHLKHRGKGSVAFGPDSRHVLAWASPSSSAELWAIRTPSAGAALERVAVWDVPLNGVMTASFSPDGGHVLVNDAREARQWDVMHGEAFGEPMPCGFVCQASYSADGDHIVSRSSEGWRLWRAATGALRGARTAPADNVNGRWAIRPSAGQNRVLMGTDVAAPPPQADACSPPSPARMGMPTPAPCAPESRASAASGTKRQTPQRAGRVQNSASALVIPSRLVQSLVQRQVTPGWVRVQAWQLPTTEGRSDPPGVLGAWQADGLLSLAWPFLLGTGCLAAAVSAWRAKAALHRQSLALAPLRPSREPA